MFPKVTLILGGAASGKSAFAEFLVRSAARPCLYLASAQPHDPEMRDRIARHRKSRGQNWRTIEEPLAVATTLRGLGPEETVLFDCATLWLSNHMLADHDVVAERAALIAALRDCAPNVVVVSNEVGHAVVPDNAMARRFCDAQGQLNIQLAACAQLVVTVTAGLPSVLKGTLPKMAT
jgi:adenosylcobinamide kinase / adenosylcobinamide-phosphate guanylyltransferase